MLDQQPGKALELVLQELSGCGPLWRGTDSIPIVKLEGALSGHLQPEGGGVNLCGMESRGGRSINPHPTALEIDELSFCIVPPGLDLMPAAVGWNDIDLIASLDCPGSGTFGAARRSRGVVNQSNLTGLVAAGGGLTDSCKHACYRDATCSVWPCTVLFSFPPGV